MISYQLMYCEHIQQVAITTVEGTNKNCRTKIRTKTKQKKKQ